jgi:hypothetical protein
VGIIAKAFIDIILSGRTGRATKNASGEIAAGVFFMAAGFEVHQLSLSGIADPTTG